MDLAVVVVAVVMFAAAFLQSATGFGMALVAMAMVPMVLPVEQAIAFVSVSCFIATIFIMIANHSGLSFRHAGPLALGMVIGIPLGYFGLRSLDENLVVRLLGAVLILISLSEIFMSRIKLPTFPERSGGLFGLFGGALAGAFNVGGPPLVVYAYSRPWSKVETVAILQTVFIAGGITRNLLVFKSGEIDGPLIRLVAWSIPTAIIGVWLGKLTLDRIPREMLRKIVFGIILLIGIKQLAFG